LEQAGVAGPVNRRRPDRGDLDAVRAAELEREPLAGGLRLLVDADRPDLVVLVRRRAVDAAVDAAGAAVHDARDAVLDRRVQQRADRLDVHRAVVAVRELRLPEGARDRIDDVDAFGRAAYRVGV